MLKFLKNLFSSKIPEKSFPGIIAAKVIKVEKHANADRLRVVELSDGTNTISPVVCGAFNFDAGDIVALALPGAQIPQNIHSQTHEPFILQKATIRGVESQGMICAAFELGLNSETGKGIMKLKHAVDLGSPFSTGMIESYE